MRLWRRRARRPANWDEPIAGPPHHRFLDGRRGARRCGRPSGRRDGRVTWAELKGYLTREVEEAARRASGREQVPEVDDAPIVLQASLARRRCAKSVAALRDEAAWRRRRLRYARVVRGLYRHLRRVCAYRPQAMDPALAGASATRGDRPGNWAKFGPTRHYQAYLGFLHRDLRLSRPAQCYLGGGDPAAPAVKTSTRSPPAPTIPTAAVRPGVKYGRIEPRPRSRPAAGRQPPTRPCAASPTSSAAPTTGPIARRRRSRPTTDRHGRQYRGDEQPRHAL